MERCVDLWQGGGHMKTPTKKVLRGIAHHLDPIVTIAGNGLSDGVQAELMRALEDHELIKIRITLEDRDDRATMLNEAVHATGAALIQKIGKTAVLYRHNKDASPKLSNVQRFAS